MAVVKLQNLKQIIDNEKKLLGVDFGSKTIGLSVSDYLLTIANPLKTIIRTKFTDDLIELLTIFDQLNIGAIIIGLPLNMDGHEGPRCQSTRQFASNILNTIDIPIVFWDERLSTVAVERMLISEVDMTRKKRRKILDKLAATYILQGALDALS